MKKRGWYFEPQRHALASKGVKTTTLDLYNPTPEDFDDMLSKEIGGESLTKFAELDEDIWQGTDIWISDEIRPEKKKDIFSSLMIIEKGMTLGEAEYTDEIVFLSEEDNVHRYGSDSVITVNSGNILSVSDMVYILHHELGHSFLRRCAESGGQYHFLLDNFVGASEKGGAITHYTKNIEDETVRIEEDFAEVNAIFRGVWRNFMSRDDMTERQREVYEEHPRTVMAWEKLKRLDQKVWEMRINEE